MSTSLKIMNMFNLSDGLTVLACEGDALDSNMIGKQVELAVNNVPRQVIHLSARRHLFNASDNLDQIAFETNDEVKITISEAQSGFCTLKLKD